MRQSAYPNRDPTCTDVHQIAYPFRAKKSNTPKCHYQKRKVGLESKTPTPDPAEETLRRIRRYLRTGHLRDQLLRLLYLSAIAACAQRRVVVRGLFFGEAVEHVQTARDIAGGGQLLELHLGTTSRGLHEETTVTKIMEEALCRNHTNGVFAADVLELCLVAPARL